MVSRTAIILRNLQSQQRLPKTPKFFWRTRTFETVRNQRLSERWWLTLTCQRLSELLSLKEVTIFSKIFWNCDNFWNSKEIMNIHAACTCPCHLDKPRFHTQAPNNSCEESLRTAMISETAKNFLNLKTRRIFQNCDEYFWNYEESQKTFKTARIFGTTHPPEEFWNGKDFYPFPDSFWKDFRSFPEDFWGRKSWHPKLGQFTKLQ